MTQRVPGDDRVSAAARAVAGSRWRLLRHGAAPGAWNMAVDEVLLGGVASGSSPPTLRLYGWDPPALSLGRFQPDDADLNLEICRRRGWEIVRRITGGRAVLHDREITFAFVIPLSLVAQVGVLPSYCLLARAVNAGLARLGVSATTSASEETCSPLSQHWERGARGVRATPDGATASCFATSLAPDSLVGGRKLVGAAQARRGGALLQHGSILLDVDRQSWTELFGGPGEIVTLAELMPRRPDREELEEQLSAGIAAALGIRLEAGELTDREQGEVRAAAGRPPATRSPGRHAALDSA